MARTDNRDGMDQMDIMDRMPGTQGVTAARCFELREVAACLLILGSLFSCTGEIPESETPSEALSPLRVGSVMAEGNADLSGYARAVEPRDFSFPADHGPHPDFQSEWWYFVGNLDTESSEPRRHFGFQLTFFRFAVAPDPISSADRTSAWASRQMWMAHFALSDLDGGRFHAFERFRRGALDLAGATAGEDAQNGESGENGENSLFRVWLDDWSATGLEPGSLLPLRLQAVETKDGVGEVGLDLVLSPGKPTVLQGDRGLSRKGPEPGNASYYYSQTRMPAQGTVTLGGERFAVSGTAWMDREWSTSALGEGEVGWDWFSLQLTDADGEPWELMLYQIRREDDSASPQSEGLWVKPDGTSRQVSWDDTEVDVLDRWQSPESGATYPAGWRLRLPDLDLDLTVQPLLVNQELDVSFRYWEGAVEITGTHAGKPVTGRGYVELTGYGERP